MQVNPNLYIELNNRQYTGVYIQSKLDYSTDAYKSALNGNTGVKRKRSSALPP